MRELIDHLLSCIVTVKTRNAPEWMEYIAEEMNKTLKALGDPDRIKYSKRGDLVIVRRPFDETNTNHHSLPQTRHDSH